MIFKINNKEEGQTKAHDKTFEHGIAVRARYAHVNPQKLSDINGM